MPGVHTSATLNSRTSLMKMGKFSTVPLVAAKKKKFVTTVAQTGTDRKICFHGIDAFVS